MSNIKISQKVLNQEEKITLDLLEMVEENSAITQRSLATELNVALGLANSYIKRCAKKGLIKVKQVPSNRYAYYLTPNGFAEKGRLTAEYLKQSFNFFRLARGQSDEALRDCINRGWNSVALIGKSDLTEITILSATELNVKLTGIVDTEASIDNMRYMNLPVVKTLSELDTVDALIITDMEKPQNTFNEIVQFFPSDQVLTLSLLGIKRQKGNTPTFIEAVAEKIG
jgi:predicted transcriptional regulator